jgi:hypothetical protein
MTVRPGWAGLVCLPYPASSPDADGFPRTARRHCEFGTDFGGFVMATPSTAWAACESCKAGRVALFTSVSRCDRCAGTGIAFSDERMSMAVAPLLTLVRTRKYLHRCGVHTLGELLRFAALGGLPRLESDNSSVADDIRRVLRDHGLWLPVAPDPTA